MQKEKLIEEVRKYPLLYDLSDSKYSDVNKKEKAWNEIAIVLSQPASECKKIWQNLREYHRRAIKKKATKSGQSATTNKKWQYETEMSFLLPHYKERSTVTSVDNTDDGDDENSLSAAEIFANLTNNEESQDSSITSERPESSVSMYESSKSVFPDIPKTTQTKEIARNKRRKLDFSRSDDVDKALSLLLSSSESEESEGSVDNDPELIMTEETWINVRLDRIQSNNMEEENLFVQSKLFTNKLPAIINSNRDRVKVLEDPSQHQPTELKGVRVSSAVLEDLAVLLKCNSCRT
ncbi:uncharacterized protein LOC125236145 [Leguminivora glycinivorella]|uniref:uncharacterized protein LOC125236145 n=1 Tax=Leguminivora glycinivorella TaxID=1035111 RepID=UPI00200D84CA|nr:uncharacterized protein LOC125236145 [Leguminivora glycinivorella]